MIEETALGVVLMMPTREDEGAATVRLRLSHRNRLDANPQLSGFARKFFAESSDIRFADNADASLSTIARFRSDRDFHVLAKHGQEAHQPVTQEVSEPAIEEPPIPSADRCA